MKVIKEFTHILFVRPIGLQGNLFLSVAVGSFFNLDQPEQLGTEVDLWKLAAETLGKDALLDEGNPKPVGEFLVCGKCWSTTGKSVVSSEVGVRVGQAAKILYVFGEREWLPAGIESPVSISSPKPFMSMPIRWENAYGGEGYAMNPVGKGIQPETPFDYWPLPNIETGSFIRFPTDKPIPAGFGMLGFSDPRHHRAIGAYDQNWLENHGPYYPDDFDQAFFNCAAADQRLEEGYFLPGEPILIHYMHPGKPRLHSHVPNIRQRAFIQQQLDNQIKFVEAPLQIDTVWLWPEQERGLVLARGLFSISDGDGDDVQLLFTATEPSSEPPRSLDEWEQELKQRLECTIPADLSPLVPGFNKLAE